jgi:hypothetical protein
MKRLLPLFAAALLCGASAQAGVELTRVTGAMFSHTSPSGEWAVSCGDGNFFVYNLKTGEWFMPEEDEDNYDLFYEAGYGNCMTDTGIVVGSTTYSGTAAYYSPDTNEWTELQTLSSASSSAHGITPDASRIVGYTMNTGVTYGDDAVVSIPLLWERNNDGGYDMKVLPYPTTDFTGKRTPQYIIAHAISADGKTIIGQVTDYAGFYHSPIVFTEDADGNWSYEYVNVDIQKCGVEFPDWYPYDGPSYPQITDYMTSEESAAYQAAYEEWQASGYTGTYPEYTDYISEEGYAAYEAAYETYKTAYAEWSEMDDAFSNAYWSLSEEYGAPDFLMNSVALSPNGRYYGVTEASGDFWSGYSYTPGYLDMQNDGEYTKYAQGPSVTFISDNAEMLGVEAGLDGYTRLAYIKTADADEFVRLNQYVKSLDEDAYQEMEDSMTATYIQGIDYDTYDYIYSTDILDGLPTASDDMKTICAWTVNMYTDSEEDYQYSMVYKITEGDGVGRVVAGNEFSVKANLNGEIVINGDAAAIEIYDFAGNIVYSNNAPASVVKTNLTSGLYLIKATAKNGKKVVTKAAFNAKA